MLHVDHSSHCCTNKFLTEVITVCMSCRDKWLDIEPANNNYIKNHLRGKTSN